ncbi:MAG TPA: FAD-binding oxidoreductase [Thermomicrobiales bacterium]|nr:FAD-binding oxidoreductase [Thermomicrobiales bacterium]
MPDPSLPTSYWHATFPPSIPDDALPTRTDVAVIGGGMLGCWTAYWLARQGADVTLLERDVISWGATGRNGGFLMSGGAMSYGTAIDTFGRDTAREIWTLAAEGQARAVEIIGEEGIDCDLRTPGSMTLALSDDALDRMRQDAALMAEDGFGKEILDRHAVQELIRTPLGPEITGGAYAADGSLLHSGRYLAGIASAAKRHGAILCRAGVTTITPGEDGVTLATSAGTLRAGRVIVAVNAWSADLVPALKGVVSPVRGQILAYEPVSRVFDVGLGADITPTGEYWQQTPEGAIVIGGCRADAPNGDVGVRDMRPTTDVLDAIAGVLPRLFPELADLRISRQWAGLMAFTSDHLPVADAPTQMPGVWVAGGFCGHGMPFGPRVGQLLAGAAITGETPDVLAPLRIDRPTLSSLG